MNWSWKRQTKTRYERKLVGSVWRGFRPVDLLKRVAVHLFNRVSDYSSRPLTVYRLPFSVCTSIPGAVRHCQRTKLRNDERKGNSFDRQTSGETSSYKETRKRPCFVDAVRLDGERKISVSPASTNTISREKLVFSLETVVKRKPRACSSSSPVTWIVSYRIPI